MRVLGLTNLYPYPERPSYGAFVKAQIDSLVEHGCQTDVMFIEGYRSTLEYARAVGLVRKAVRETEFDLIHAHYGLSGLIAVCQRRCPVVISFMGDDLLGTPDPSGGHTLKSRIVRSGSRVASLLADAAIVKSSQMLDHLPGTVARSRTTVIPNGVDFSLFQPMARDKAREDLGLDPETPIVLFPSTPYEYRKRIDLAQSALERVRREVPSAELLQVYHQPQARMPVYMSAADAMVLTSDWEGSSNVIKEAMACNLPIVSVDAGDAWHIIENTAMCARVDRSAESIADGLLGILRTRKRSNGRDQIADLEIGVVARKVIHVYEAVLGARSCVA